MSKVSAADLLGVEAIGDNCMLTSVVIVAAAVDMQTGKEQLFIIEDDYTMPWKAYGMLAYAKDTYDAGFDPSDDTDDSDEEK